MARPRYIVCAENMLTDRATGLPTYINVLDTINAVIGTETAPRNNQLPSSNIFISASWMRDEDDEGEFEYGISVTWPNGQSEDLTDGHFDFRKQFHRIDCGTTFPAKKVTCSGVLIFHCRIRPSGGDWIAQEFTIPVNVSGEHPQSEANAASSREPSNP